VYRPWQRGQRWDQPTREPSNESTKVERGGSIRGRKPVSARRCGAAGSGGGRAASQKSRPAGRERKKREEKKIEKETTEESEVFIPGPAAGGRLAQSGRAKPKQETHRQRDYLINYRRNQIELVQ
jgi:hypothetical protein